jgi:hypothetical protein
MQMFILIPLYCRDEGCFVSLFTFLPIAQEFFSYMETSPNVAGEGLQNLGLCSALMLGTEVLWAGRDLYRATPAVTRGLVFFSLIRKTAPFSRLLPHSKGMWRTYSFPDPREHEGGGGWLVLCIIVENSVFNGGFCACNNSFCCTTYGDLTNKENKCQILKYYNLDVVHILPSIKY